MNVTGELNKTKVEKCGTYKFIFLFFSIRFVNFFYIEVISDCESVQKNMIPYSDEELDFLNKA